MWNIRKIVSKGNYNYAIVPDHPNRTKNNYVLEHRIVMENHLGRLLTEDEIVHHKDENGKHNHIDNLEILSSSEHARLHMSTGRKTSRLICAFCNQVFYRYDNQVNNYKRKNYFCSRPHRIAWIRKEHL